MATYEDTINKVRTDLEKYDSYSKEPEPRTTIRERREEIIKPTIAPPTGTGGEPMNNREKIIDFIKKYVLVYVFILMLLLSIQPDFIIDDNVARKGDLVYYKHHINWTKTLLYTTLFYIPYFIWMISDKVNLSERVRKLWK